MASALSCENVSVAFGAFRALNKLTLDFSANRTCAIIGPNGAGKTTFLNVLSGVLRPTEGRVSLGGREITQLAPERRARLGMGRSFQIPRVFVEMTARENLRVGAQRTQFRIQPFWVPTGRSSSVERAVEETLHLVGLEDKADVEAGRLSHGSQRALEIGLTLVTKPDVILFDEPLAGIGHHEVGPMVQLLRTVSQGKTTILIEHNMDAVMAIADEIVVFAAGELLARGEPSAIQQDPAVRRAYLGQD